MKKNAHRSQATAPVSLAEKLARLKAATARKAACSQKTCEQDNGEDDNPPRLRLMPKREVLKIVGCTYPTLWEWMRSGRFPRSRRVGIKAMWLSSEVDQWLAALPTTKLKGDEPNVGTGS